MTKPSNLRDAAEVAATEADQSAAEAWLNANNGEWIDALNLAEAFARHRAAVEAETERLREALGLIIENESADTGYGNSSAKIALAALGDWKSGAGDLGGDHVR